MNLIEIPILIFRWAIFIFSMSGLILKAKEKLQVQLEFIPIFICSSLSLWVFYGGLLGLLYPSIFVPIILGLFFFFQWAKEKPYYRFSFQNFSLAPLGFGVGAALFLIQLLQTNFVHYDNYSHWGLVVKEMLITKAFPTVDSVLIDFTNYPLGISSFNYYLCELLGASQSHMLFAQGIFTFSCLYALFGIIREKKRFLLYIFLGTGCSLLSLFNLTIRINNLLVDFILPILALSIIAATYRYHEELEKVFILTYPMIGLLVIVKSTGIIYAGFGLIYLFYILFKTKCPSLKHKIQLLGKGFAFSLISLNTTFLWHFHVKTAFAGVENKFELTATKMQGIYGGKTPADVASIVELFIKSALDYTTRPTIGIILFVVLALIFSIVGIKATGKKWKLPQTLLVLSLMLVLYYSGILAMYIFSMPLEEALYLAGFERYACSIVIFFGGALTMCMTVDMENSFYYPIGEVPDYRSFKSLTTKTIYNNAVVVCLSLSILILTSEYNGLQFYISDYPDSLPAKVSTVVGDNWVEEVDHSRYLVYASDANEQVTNQYLQYVVKYYLRSDHVDSLCYFYEDNFLNLLSAYDYLVIIERDTAQQALMEKYLGVSGEAGIYPLSQLL